MVSIKSPEQILFFICSISESIIALNNSIHGTKHDQKMQFFSFFFAEAIQTTPAVTLATAEKPGSFVFQMRILGHRKESRQKSLR